MPTCSRAVAVLASLALSTGACTADDGEPAPTTDTDRSVCTTADGEGLSVGLAYDVGGRGDHGLNDAAYDGLVTAVEELDVTCAEAEARPAEPASGRAELLRKMAVEGKNPVIAVGSAYSAPAAEVAVEFPETRFAVIGAEPGVSGPRGNVAHLAFDDTQGAYLVGAAAAARTESGTVGIVGLTDTPAAVVTGFRGGARAQDQDVVVRVRLVERPRALRAATRAMLRLGADVVLDASGLPDPAVVQEVDSAEPGRAIGFGVDLRSVVPVSLQEVVLTSMLRRADQAILAVVRATAEGEPLAGVELLGVASEGVGWSDSGDLPDEVAEALEAASQRLEARGRR